jgi:hypothetical protein
MHHTWGVPLQANQLTLLLKWTRANFVGQVQHPFEFVLQGTVVQCWIDTKQPPSESQSQTEGAIYPLIVQMCRRGREQNVAPKAHHSSEEKRCADQVLSDE